MAQANEPCIVCGSCPAGGYSYMGRPEAYTFCPGCNVQFNRHFDRTQAETKARIIQYEDTLKIVMAVIAAPGANVDAVRVAARDAGKIMPELRKDMKYMHDLGWKWIMEQRAKRAEPDTNGPEELKETDNGTE